MKELYFKKKVFPFVKKLYVENYIEKYVKDNETYLLNFIDCKFYIKNYKIHRENGPAITSNNGDEEWYQNGQLHRENGPAIEKNNGEKVWYINDKIHRDDGPAIEWDDGDEEWYKNGELHRENGPAVIRKEIKEWWRNGQRHQEDGPAMEWSNGTKKWFINGKLHRLNGPAIEYINGDEEWYVNGKYHRIDGAAIIYNNTPVEEYEEYCENLEIIPNENKMNYFINDIEYSEERYYKIVKLIERSEKKIVDKYARMWYEKCDKIGSKIYYGNMERGWKEIEKLYI